MVIEFWVMKVVLHPGPVIGRRKSGPNQRAAVTMADLAPSARTQCMAAIGEGKLAVLPDGCIAEPVEVFERQLDADAHREVLVAKYPGEDFRVVLNSSVTL